jgi:hypothetical protein
MIAADPKDVGAHGEFWFPGELSTALYPEMHIEEHHREETLTSMFTKSDIETYWQEDPAEDGLWKLGDHKDSKSLFGWLFKQTPSGFNSRWIFRYRKKIVEAFLQDDTIYVEHLLYLGKGRGLASDDPQKRDARKIMMVAFTKRHRNGVYGVQDGEPIVVQPRTLIAYVLLVSDFVFSLGTMKILYNLLGRDFSPHPMLGRMYITHEDRISKRLSPDYTPLHDYPKPGHFTRDAQFIMEAFLHPQSILQKGLTKQIEKQGKRNSKYKKHMYHDKAYLMISAQWLNIVNLIGYKPRTTTYMKKCFPTLLFILIQFRQETQISNLREFAIMLNEFLFGENRLFEIDKDDLKVWSNYCIPNLEDDFICNNENWVKEPWVHFSFKEDIAQNKTHPFYPIRERKLTMTNIVEWLFLGKMWQTDHSPANYTNANAPFYDDATFQWAEKAFCPQPYTFRPFNERELDEDKKTNVDESFDESDDKSDDDNDDDDEDEGEDERLKEGVVLDTAETVELATAQLETAENL